MTLEAAILILEKLSAEALEEMQLEALQPCEHYKAVGEFEAYDAAIHILKQVES